MKSPRTRSFAWIALIAVLLAALAPMRFARIAAAGDGMPPWMEICSLAAPAGQAGSPADDGHGATPGKHCPWCVNQSAHFALPTSSLDLPLLASRASPVLMGQADSPAIQGQRSPQQPRAPPHYS